MAAVEREREHRVLAALTEADEADVEDAVLRGEVAPGREDVLRQSPGVGVLTREARSYKT